MNNNITGRPLFLLFVFWACTALPGCEKPALYSSWENRGIVVDGKYSDWGESMTYYDEKTKTVLNLANDADYLYVCLVTRNRELEAQIMESGLFAWFDPEGREKRAFGIRFPVGLKMMGIEIEEDKDKKDITRDWQDQVDKSELIDRGKERLSDKNFNKRLETLEGLQDRLEIAEAGGNPKGKGKHPGPPSGKTGKPGSPEEDKPHELLLAEAAKLGIEAKVGREKDYFVYELKVPLIKSSAHPQAINIKPGKPVGLGLEIPMSGPGNQTSPGGGGDENALSVTGSGMRSQGDLQLWATVMLAGAKDSL